MANKPHIPTIDEVIELPDPGDARISPDGSYVAYVVRTPDWKQNEYISQIWLVQIPEAEDAQPTPRQLTFAKESSWRPRWSPDGEWLAFLSKREGDEHSQIYRLCPFGGEAERLTELEADIKKLAWSPNGKAIAFIAPDPETQADKDRQEKYGDYQVEDQDHKYAHLWLLQLTDKKCRKLTGGHDFHLTGFDWSPDGGQIVFGATPTPDISHFDRGRIYFLDLATLAVNPLTAEGCQSPRWSPDGRLIAFSQFGDPTFYANNAICIISAAGGEAQAIPTNFDEDHWLIDWGPNGIYFAATQRTNLHLFHLDPTSYEITQLTPDQAEGWVSIGWHFSQDFTRAAMVVSDAGHCAEVTGLDLPAGAIRRLTNFNAQIKAWQLGRSEVFHWTSYDGTPVEGVLTKPADFDPQQKYPLLVVIHGGPVSTSFQMLLDTYERRYYPIQQWVAKGALVLQPNYRGSAGYGEAFRSLNVRNLGVGDYEDVISGVEALIAEGWVDPERVGAMGWSQGGYISAFITTFSDRFKAVSVGAGISNWMTYYVNTDIHPFTRQYLQNNPWEDPEIYAKTSPMTYIKQAKTPTLIQHGEFDRRVPIPNAYELYQGLQDMGVETKLVVYKGMPHGISKPRLTRQVMEENFAWFNRWLWGEEPAETDRPPCYIALASAEQHETSDELPAIERYTAPRIHDVYHWARRDGAEFRILSAKFGLLSPTEPVSPDDQKLAAEAVSALAVQVAEQLKALGTNKLVVYTRKAENKPKVLMYLGCLQVAAGIIGGVRVEHQEIAEEKGW